MPRTRFGLTAILLLASCSHAFAGSLPVNWPVAPSEAERRLANDHFVITEVKSAGAGVTGASKLRITFDDGKVWKVKWKQAVNSSFDGWNNSPRRELATYEVQRWFLDENDYLVPTSVGRCIPLSDYKPLDATPEPTIEGTNCVLGVLTLWIDHAYAPESMVDAGPVEKDPKFAAYKADFNLLTYLVDHRDGRKGNFLISTEASDPRIFAIDNGISFEAFPWNFLVPNWNKIRVPWLRKQSIDRLRQIKESDIEKLGVVAEMRLDENGMWLPTTPGPNIDDDKPVKRKGPRLQVGVDEDEIDDLEARLKSLLKKIDAGKIAVR